MSGFVPAGGAVGGRASKAASVRRATSKSWMSRSVSARQTTTHLLYVSDFSNGLVNVYDGDNPLSGVIGQLTGLSFPNGMTTDRAGNLYVADEGSGNIYIFRPGETTPATTLDDTAYSPVDVAVDSDGTVYVANIGLVGEQPPGNVVVYSNVVIDATPRTYTATYTITDPHFSFVNSVGLDDKHNLYVTNNTSSDYGANYAADIVQFAPGSHGPGTELAISDQTGAPYKFQFPGGIRFDPRYQTFLVNDQGLGGPGSDGRTLVMKRSTTAARMDITRQIGHFGAPYRISLENGADAFFIANPKTNEAGRFAYGTGRLQGAMTADYGPSAHPFGVAASFDQTCDASGCHVPFPTPSPSPSPSPAPTPSPSPTPFVGSNQCVLGDLTLGYSAMCSLAPGGSATVQLPINVNPSDSPDRCTAYTTSISPSFAQSRVAATISGGAPGGPCLATLTVSITVTDTQPRGTAKYHVDFDPHVAFTECFADGHCAPGSSYGQHIGVFIGTPLPTPNPCAGGGIHSTQRAVRSASPDPCATPPPPLGAILAEEADGPVRIAADGSQSAYDAVPQTLVYVSGTPTTATASATRSVQSTLNTTGPPPLYLAWPNDLPESHDLTRNLIAFTSKLTGTYGCELNVMFGPADPTKLDSPKNQALMQSQAYCYNGAVMKSARVLMGGTGFNSNIEDTMWVDLPPCVIRGSAPFGGTRCFSPVFARPLVSGHAELSRLVSGSFIATGPLNRGWTFGLGGACATVGTTTVCKGDFAVGKLPINNRVANYPYLRVDADTGPGGEGFVRFPDSPFVRCFEVPKSQLQNNCQNYKGASTALGADLTKANFPVPTTGSYEPHHIKPLSWGGDNCAHNGVWLQVSPVNEHQNFTTWWLIKNFTPDPTTLALPVPPC